MFGKTIITLGMAALAAGPLQANANEQVVGTLLGAGIGAAVGHGVGGHDGAVVGGLVGAVAGAAITNDYRERVHYREPVAVEADRYYVPERGTVVRQPAVAYVPERVVVERPRHSHRWWQRDRWDRWDRCDDRWDRRDHGFRDRDGDRWR